MIKTALGWIKKKLCFKRRPDSIRVMGIEIIPRWGLAIELLYSPENGYTFRFHLGYPHIRIPVKLPKPKTSDYFPSWGFEFGKECVFYGWGREVRRVFFYPWDMCLYKIQMQSGMQWLTTWDVYKQALIPDDDKMLSSLFHVKRTMALSFFDRQLVERYNRVEYYIKRQYFKPKCLINAPFVKGQMKTLIVIDFIKYSDQEEQQLDSRSIATLYDENRSVIDNIRDAKNQLSYTELKMADELSSLEYNMALSLKTLKASPTYANDLGA